MKYAKRDKTPATKQRENEKKSRRNVGEEEEKEMQEMKPHWQRFFKLISEYQNGKCTLQFRDGLPYKIDNIEGRAENIDLTKEEEK